MLAFGMLVVGFVLGIAVSALYVASGKAAGKLYVETRHEDVQRHEVDVRLAPPPAQETPPGGSYVVRPIERRRGELD